MCVCRSVHVLHLFVYHINYCSPQCALAGKRVRKKNEFYDSSAIFFVCTSKFSCDIAHAMRPSPTVANIVNEVYSLQSWAVFFWLVGCVCVCPPSDLAPDSECFGTGDGTLSTEIDLSARQATRRTCVCVCKRVCEPFSGRKRGTTNNMFSHPA